MDLNNFTYLDYVVCTLIFLSTIFALFRGFVGSSLSLIGWVASVALSYKLYPLVEPFLLEKFTNKGLVYLLGYGGLLVIFLIMFGILNAVLNSVLVSLKLTFFDKLLGAIFGFFRGLLLASFFYLCWITILSLTNGVDYRDEKDVTPGYLKNSQCYLLLKYGKDIILSFTSEDFQERLNNSFKAFSSKDKSDRFMTFAIAQMMKDMPQDIVKRIKDVDAKNSLTKSERDVEKDTLKQLYEYHKSNHTDQDLGFTDQDILKIEKIVKTLKTD